MRQDLHQKSKRTLRCAATAGLVIACVSVFAQHADADVDVVDLNGIDVVQINGLIDPPNASLLSGAITDAEDRDSTLLVIQLDSKGALDVDVEALHEQISTATVPIVVWIGPAGSTARSAAAYLVEAAPYVSMASNASIGFCDWVLLDWGQLDDRAPACEPRRTMNAAQAREAGLVDRIDASLRNLLTELDGTTIETGIGDKVKLSTKVVVPGEKGGDPTTSINQDLRFQKLSVFDQLLHTLNASWVAYLLFVMAISLIVFEFYAASIGAAAVVGAICLVCALVGFSHLPVTWWGVALLALGLGALTIDLQAGGVGFWSAVGILDMIAGSIMLYGGSAQLDLRWWTIALVVTGTIAFFVGGLPAMMRTRFSTPTIGREGIIGEMGTAETDIGTDGVVKVREALWKARTNRATPIASGAVVRVVAVEGVALEVEPEIGGAEDYREKAKKRKSGD